MKKHSKNKQGIQLELPFAKSTYKNNVNNFIIRETILNYSEQKDKDDCFYWFD